MSGLPHRRLVLTAAAAALAVPRAALAQAWPEGRTITVLVPFPAGGGTDVVARVVTDRLGAATKARYVIENRPGGGGSIGYGAAIRSAPDGATAMITSSALSTMPALYPSKGYQPLRDLVPVSLICEAPSFVCVGPSVQARTLAELIAEARRRPGELTYASAGIGSGLHLSAELLNKTAGINIKHVPYKGAALATGDLLGGRIDMIVDSLPSVRQLVESGQLRALAITTPRRYRLMPDIPPVADTLPGFDYSAWFGLFLPARAPAELADTLQRGLKEALASPEVQDRAGQLGLEMVGSRPAEFARFLEGDLDRWGKLVRELGISADG